MSDKKEETTPTWGFHATEPAQIFELKKGEKLPHGWKDTPAAFDNSDDDDKRRTRQQSRD